MECYNCGAALGAASYCPKCGADVKVYKRILMASNSFYNDGLDKANVRNLSGAVESLKKSLQFNKMNTDARNLLGLIYFEMGDTVAALSEWVISKNYQSRDNAASRYLNEIQNNTSRLEAINQTIKKYNQALTYCRQGSKDLAVIQLRKVLSLNPKLIKGHQLLALLYMEDGKYEQAKKALLAAEKIDENNVTTLRYLKEVNRKIQDMPSKKKKKNDDLISYQSGNDTIIMPARFKDNTALATIVNIVIGIALGIAIMVFLLLPNIRQQAQSEANESLKSANDAISTKEQTISSLEGQVEDMQKQTEEAQSQAEAAESKLTSYEELLNAYSSYTAEDVESAAAALEKVKEEDLGSSAKAVYSEVNAKVNEKYLSALYEEGYSAYSKGDYETAIEKLLKVVEMDETYQDGNSVYYLAQSYRRNDDMDNALIYYEKVLEQCPGTQRASTAKTYVDAYGGSSSDDSTAGRSSGDESGTSGDTGNTNGTGDADGTGGA